MLAQFVIGYGGSVREIDQLTESLANELLAHKHSMVAAESCTGGLLSAQLTSIPGSSDWFEGAFVTYQSAAKISMLGVPEELLARFGAVSEPTARAMAEGALHATSAHLSVAITGIAGPSGGDVLTPVGTVWFAWASRQAPGRVYASRHCLTGARGDVRLHAVQIALEGTLEVAAGLAAC